MSINEDNMYLEHILDLYKNPLNYGEMENPTLMRKGFNPLCGDDLEVFLKVEGDSIKDVKFSGEGCAISIASASIVSDYIIGKSIEDVMKLGREDVVGLLGITISSGRIKCALLFLKTVQEMLE